MSTSRTGIVAVALAAAMVAAAGAASATGGLSAPATTTLASTARASTVRIAGNVLPSLAMLPSVAAPLDQVLSIGVALAHPDTRGELAL